jgi:hypothetical protein
MAKKKIVWKKNRQKSWKMDRNQKRKAKYDFVWKNLTANEKEMRNG